MATNRITVSEIYIYFKDVCRLSRTWQNVVSPNQALYSLETYLELDVGFRLVLFTSAPAGDLLRFGDLVPHRLGAEVFQRETLDGIDAQYRARLDNSEPARHCGG
jgi:hypothetical protein